MADLAVWQRTIVDEEGNVIPGAEIEVRREEDDSLATLYADRAGETPLANPLAADMSGFVRFFAQGDAYTITAVGAGSTRTWRFDPTGRLQEFDRVSDALSVAGGVDTLGTRKRLGDFDTVADVEAADIPPVLESIRTAGRAAPGDGPPLNLVRGSNVPGAVQSADGQWWEDVGYNTITVSIPSQFPTLQAAIDHYSRLPMRNLSEIVLLLEQGYEIPGGSNVMYNVPSLGGSDVAALLCRGGDFSRFVIRSEDNHTVPVTDDFSGSLIVGEWAEMPRLECIIDMKGLGNGGYFVSFNSLGWIEEGCGVINAGRWGCRLRNTSGLYGRGAVLTGAGTNGFFGAHGCWAQMRDADCSGAGDTGVVATAMAMFDAVNITADDCANRGIYVNYCGDVMLLNGSAKRAGTDALEVVGTCSVNAANIDLSDAGRHAFRAEGGVSLNLDGANLDNPGSYPYRIFGGGNFVSIRDTSQTGWTSSPSMHSGSLVGTNQGVLGRYSGDLDTSGSLLLPQGRFGLGADRLLDISPSTFEALENAGFYGFWSASSGPEGPGWSAAHMPRTVTHAGQLAVRADGSDHIDLAAVRTSDDAEAAAWYKWRQLIHTGRIVGSVSDDGDGDPNGAIFQSGGTAPEGYILYADGTMECWTWVDLGDPTAEGDGTYADPYRSEPMTWVYPTPVAFDSRPTVTITPYVTDDNSVARCITAVFRAATVLDVKDIQLVRVSSSAKTGFLCGANIQVKGRWK